MYLLDTSVFSDLIKRPGGPVTRRIASVGEDAICTSIVVACELRFGAEKKRSTSLTAKVEQIIANIEVLSLDVDADAHYATIRNDLELRGETIGPNDLLIAAHARSLGLILVTDNVREFARVPGLSVENWLTLP
ncbi:type II toxin-antitoxin system VapC family toxin [Geomonas subterranea]|uniref:Ribonuclease VapC n=1 Tax=Geomonas subterranea TaxID=2847989 RepID=A0ABX8LGB1_9BACT|nr:MULTISPECIES: type II toxin-antitoxin system VapC family toxin [Geomonas]QXE89725.1 type II toxin-antitoxin system VapC family toxin [Geomonas subterranea]QXM08159.1 type II toxin-antitoxin system VapC family toxin [Geomonas subterranea]